MLASMKPRGGAEDMPAPTANVGNITATRHTVELGHTVGWALKRFWAIYIMAMAMAPCEASKRDFKDSSQFLHCQQEWQKSIWTWENQSIWKWESVREQNIWIESEHVRTWNWNLGVPDQRMPQEWWAILEVQAWAWQRKIMTLDHWTGLELQSNHEPLQKGEFCNTACLYLNKHNNPFAKSAW